MRNNQSCKLEMAIVFTGGNYGSSIANQAFKIVTKLVLPAVQDQSSAGMEGD